MSGGSISATTENIGNLGHGETSTFNQSGGTNTVSGNLAVGAPPGYGDSGTYTISAGSLIIEGDLAINQGIFNCNGDTITVAVTVDGGVINNVGTFNMNGGTLTADVENSHAFNYDGGTIYGNVDNTGNFTVDLPGGGTLYINGNFTNETSGIVKTYGTTLDVIGTMICNGTYNSDPADNYFGSMSDGRKSAMKGGIGDHFFLSGDLLSKSREKQDWNTQLAALIFDGGDGQHVLDVTGLDMGASWSGYDNNFSWGLLSLASGQSLDLVTKSGFGHAGLYVGSLELADGVAQIADINTKHVNIYYDAQMNPWLDDGTYSLTGGGELIPVDGDNPLSSQFALVVAAVPEPSSGIFGILVLGLRIRRRDAVV